MKRIHLLILALLFLTGCRKTEPPLPPLPCEQDNWGNLRIENPLTDDYEVYFDGVLQTTIDAGTTVTLPQFPAGSYLVELRNVRTGVWSYLEDFELVACRGSGLVVW